MPDGPASNDAPPDTRRHFPAPPANKGLLVLAGVLCAIPIIALMLVNTYAKKEPMLGGFPFFFWYQFLWVFLCSAFTYAAYVVVQKARPHRPMNAAGDEYLVDESEEKNR
jgi:hypothetical protein